MNPRDRHHLLLRSVWMALFIEFLSRRSLGEALLWTVRHIPAFLLNAMLMLALLLLLAGLTARRGRRRGLSLQYRDCCLLSAV